MNISLGNRSAETVKTYFEKAQIPEIKRMLPQKARTVQEALEDYSKTLLPNADSYGRTIIAGGKYIGDIWCYHITAEEEPNAMLSFCIFDKAYWSHGIATQAAAVFLRQVKEKYRIRTIGAFVFSDNHASIQVLAKNHFSMLEEFTEDGRASKYFQASL